MTDTDHTSSRKQPGTRPEDHTDWVALGRQLQNIQNILVHHESTPRYGDDYYAEALRRLLTDPGCGWISSAEHQWLLDLHTQVDRRNAQEANRRAPEARGRYATASRKVRAALAGWLRRVTNEQTVPSHYRREGVLLAAEWLDPATSSAPYASSPASAASSSPQQAAVSPVGSEVLLALRNAGEREGRLAVGWWQQHALEGRTASEQAQTAQTVLEGIDSSDDAVVAALPRFDVAGYDADRYQAHAPVGAPGWSELPDRDQALVIDAVRDGFTDAVRRCRRPLPRRPDRAGGDPMTYQPGERVALEHTSDPHTLLRPGDEGTVRHYHPGLQVLEVNWDSGSCLSMVLDAGDRVRRLPAPIGEAGWEQVLDAVRIAGAAAGRDAAVWWVQNLIGGRATGDVREVARQVLAGASTTWTRLSGTGCPPPTGTSSSRTATGMPSTPGRVLRRGRR